jgi:hypothetical protein
VSESRDSRDWDDDMLCIKDRRRPGDGVGVTTGTGLPSTVDVSISSRTRSARFAELLLLLFPRRCVSMVLGIVVVGERGDRGEIASSSGGGEMVVFFSRRFWRWASSVGTRDTRMLCVVGSFDYTRIQPAVSSICGRRRLRK